LVGFALEPLERIEMNLSVCAPVLERPVGGHVFLAALLVLRKQGTGHPGALNDMTSCILANEARPVVVRLMQLVGFVQTITGVVDFGVNLIGAHIVGGVSAFELGQRARDVLSIAARAGMATAASAESGSH
jgi:hypothetical protein